MSSVQRLRAFWPRLVLAVLLVAGVLLCLDRQTPPVSAAARLLSSHPGELTILDKNGVQVVLRN